MRLKLMLTIDEVCQETGMSRGYIEKEIREGRLTRQKCGKAVRVRGVDLEAWAATKIVGTPTGPGYSPTDTVKNQVVEKTVGTRS